LWLPPISSDAAFIGARAAPQLASDLERVDAGRLPPGALVTDAVDRAVMLARYLRIHGRIDQHASRARSGCAAYPTRKL